MKTKGEKYEAILEELEEELETRARFVIPDEYLCNIGGATRYLIKVLKEKYFPELKPKKPETWEGFICVDFAKSESIIIKMVVVKDKDGNIRISHEPQEIIRAIN